MARIRSIKPEFFDDPDVIDLTPITRLLFIGLWTQADRRGRLVDEPRRLKIRLLPGDEADVNALLDDLELAGLLVRYSVDGLNLIWIRNFEKHQIPHHREAESVLPACPYPASPGPAQGKPSASPGKAQGQPGASPLDQGMDQGMVNGSGSGVRKDGVPPSPRPGKTTTKPLGYKPRIDVAWPGRPPVPAALHAEFIDKLGGDPEVARRRLEEWYPLAAAPYEDQAIGDDDFAFWRLRFRDWQGTTRKTATPPNRAPGTGAWNRYDEWCQHEPRCTTREWHDVLLAREETA